MSTEPSITRLVSNTFASIGKVKVLATMCALRVCALLFRQKNTHVLAWTSPTQGEVGGYIKAIDVDGKEVFYTACSDGYHHGCKWDDMGEPTIIDLRSARRVDYGRTRPPYMFR